ncbi:MAG: TlpA family protein disulfide reductase [Gammaproteobacteria bacterium]|nr:TlpA family protein disulfide reductase [Gammaproteobacteria bacterium]
MAGWLKRPNLVLLLIAVFAVVAVAVNFFYRQHLQDKPQVATESGTSASAVLGENRPAFTLPDDLGLSRDVGEWDGQVLVVNFWATWCQPCVREIPAFVELQGQYAGQGVQFVGIALDTLPQVQAFFDRLGLALNYPNLIGGTNAIAVAEAYGNNVGILPYTVLVDRSGKIAYAQYGELTRDSAEQMILELL